MGAVRHRFIGVSNRISHQTLVELVMKISFLESHRTTGRRTHLLAEESGYVVSDGRFLAVRCLQFCAAR